MFIFSLALVPGPVSAQSAADVIREGLELLKAKDNQGALNKFEAAAKINPNHRGAMFMRGMALNRLGRHKEALALIGKAETLGFKTSHLFFEKGWAAVRTGQWDVAIQSLENYEKAKPGNAKAAEYLGRAYLGKEDHGKAEKMLKEAMVRDAAVKPSAFYYLAILERSRGNEDAADAYVSRLLNEAPDSKLAQLVRKKQAEIKKARTAAPPKPWQVGASVTVGYNDNVFLLPEDSLLSPTGGISEKESIQTTYSADGSYTWRVSPQDNLTAGYILNGAASVEDDEADYNNHLFFANYSHAIKPGLGASARIGYAKTFVDGDNFRDQVSFRPSLVYKYNDITVLEAAYAYAYSDYDTSPTVAAVTDRDSNAHSLGLTAIFDLSKEVPHDLQVRLGTSYTWNDADGDDFDYRALSFFAAATMSFPYQLTLDIFGGLTKTDYTERNSYAFNGINLFAFRRDDYTYVGRARLKRPITPQLAAFAQIQNTFNQSNVKLYHYNQRSVSAGLEYRF
ncbi:MAG: tetratricopeptide repeat protein [Rhodospirillales bacterium]|nr:tetratricopeptide repeat protein [Rhodospirillales bacterium]